MQKRIAPSCLLFVSLVACGSGAPNRLQGPKAFEVKSAGYFNFEKTPYREANVAIVFASIEDVCTVLPGPNSPAFEYLAIQTKAAVVGTTLFADPTTLDPESMSIPTYAERGLHGYGLPQHSTGGNLTIDHVGVDNIAGSFTTVLNGEQVATTGSFDLTRCELPK